MDTERYPVDLVVTKQDFAESGWKATVAAASGTGYPTMSEALSAAARQAIHEGRISHGKVLWLLSDTCSMMLSPKSLSEPFKPFAVIERRRSAIPDDFSSADVLFLSEILDGIDDIWLRARVADLVWFLNRKLGIRFALDAIDAYIKIPLDSEIWIHGGRECWERAISLSLMLKGGAGDRIAQIEAALLTAFDSAVAKNGFFALWLAELLFEKGLAHSKAEQIATKLDALGQAFEAQGEFHHGRSYLELSAKWFQRDGKISQAADATARVAEGWVKEAELRTSGPMPSHTASASFLEKAIQTYRTIPRQERGARKIDERIVDLHRQMSEAGQRSLEEMGVVQTPGMDISAFILEAEQSVQGKPALEALCSFANVYTGAKVASVRTSAEATLRRSIMRHLLASTHVSKDGRVIAKQSAAGFDDDESRDAIALWAEMVRHYKALLALVAQGSILPAQEVLLQEHRLRESDFISLAAQSPFVPPGREQSVGKGLFLGYEKDFIGAIHVLVPQIENMIRWHLKNAHVKTTTLDADGVENENGLSTLVEVPEVTTLLGENLAFEVKALFCSAFGPNLRNQVAHGLLDDGEFYTAESVYAWWFSLRLVFNPFWNALRTTSENENSQQKDSSV